MKFIPLELKGAYLIELVPNIDERGTFTRVFCCDELKKYNLETNFIQMSTCYNDKAGLVRGMHYQKEPHGETKIVRCTQGVIKDVIIDVREDSKTYNQWFSVELSSSNNKMLYIPKGFAHGYKTLSNNSEVFYMMDACYQPDARIVVQPLPKYWE